MSKSYQIGGVLFYKLRHMKLINVPKHCGRHEDGLFSGKVLISSILESRDLVITRAVQMHLYRSRVEKPTQQLPDEAWSMADKRKIYRYIGQIDKFARADLEKSESDDEEENRKARIRRFLEFEWLSDSHWEPISTIRLAPMFPLLAIILWLIAYFTTVPQAPLPE